jgi:Flp pilus assembly secretin CpaC
VRISGQLRLKLLLYEDVSMCVDIGFAVAIRRGAWIAAALAFVDVALPVAAAEEAISIIVDQASIARVPERTTTLVVGNPLIADVSIQAGGTMVVTGKGYGVTNLIALDRTGRVLSQQLVRVSSPADHVVVYRGIARESYSCAPDCERRITLGDSPDYFDATLNETGSRNSRAQQSQTAGATAR